MRAHYHRVRAERKSRIYPGLTRLALHHHNVARVQIAIDFVAQMEGLLRRALVRHQCRQLKAGIGGQDQLVDGAFEKLFAHPRLENIFPARIGFLEMNFFRAEWK